MKPGPQGAHWRQPGMTMAIDDGCKLFVAGLPDSITEDVLRQLFEATGATIVEVSVPRDRATGRPRGFAFVTLATEQQAAEARETLDNSIQSGRSISVRPFQSAPPKRGEGRERRDPGERPERRDRPERGGGGMGGGGMGGGGRGGDDRTLYLGNLPYDASVSDVESMLTDAGVGPIVRVTLPQDADGRPRGFGFVTLGSVDAAQAAVDALSGIEIGGRRISASIARGRGERPARGPRPMGGAPRTDGPPVVESRFDGGARERPQRAPGPPPDAMPFGAIPDEGRRGDGRRRKEKKKKKAGKGSGSPGAERDDGRRERSRGGRRGRWGDEDDY